LFICICSLYQNLELFLELAVLDLCHDLDLDLVVLDLCHDLDLVDLVLCHDLDQQSLDLYLVLVPYLVLLA
jgi:hypothetical protein